MIKKLFLIVWLLLPVVPATAQTPPAGGPKLVALRRQFQTPPDDAKIMMRWWWFGPAVTKPELEREMRLMKEGGIGGFEVQPTYPLSLDDPAAGLKNLRFLSDEHLDALRFTSAKAKELGLRLDLTLGSGWPFGGPTVTIDDAAAVLRAERVKVDGTTRRVPLPDTGAGEKLLAVFWAPAGALTPENVREITTLKDGAAWLPAEAGGAGEVMFFVGSRAGMQVKRPSFGAEGFVLDHLNRAATERYLNDVGERLLSAFGAQPPHAIFCDSLEVYNQDWAADFLDEFKRRRGYDLRPWLPALVADFGPRTAAVRHDWGQTLTELLNERFLAPMQAWAKKKNTLFRIQNYGIPPAALSSNAYADLPEGEGPQWKVVRAARWASSASHIYGRPVTSSETWTWLHSPVFRASPLDLKAEADLHFLQGINQLIGHGWPYTPPGVAYPGWRFYAAGVFNEKNPWWPAMPDLALYLQRVSYLLRQGQPANDVALYLPNDDAWASFTAGKVHLIDVQRELLGPDVMPQILEAGFNLDFFDEGALNQTGRVDKDGFRLGPNAYRVVVLPGVERIPLATLQKLDAFARNGGIVIATRRIPGLAPGLQATAAEQQAIGDLARKMFEGPSAPAHFVADEKQLGRTLAQLLQPDMALDPGVSDVGFIHRQTADADIYFVANTSNARRKVTATFRVNGRAAEAWNPLNGQAAPAGGPSVALDLAPYESRVLVFSASAPASAPPAPEAKPAATLDISTDWRVSFGDAAPVAMARLHSWTDDEATRYFSGLASYEKEVDVPAAMLRSGAKVRLDFGEGTPVEPKPLRAGMQTWLEAPVREAAIVYLNGQRAGSVWCPPYTLDVTAWLRPGANKLRIAVGNLALNYMAGRRLPDYRLLTLRYGERFQAQDMDKVQPVTAGLLGPLKLIVE